MCGAYIQTVGNLVKDLGINIFGDCFCFGYFFDYCCSDSIRHSIDSGELIVFKCGFYSNCAVDECGILKTFKDCTHIFCGCGSPCAVFNKCDCTVLKVVGNKLVEKSFHRSIKAIVVCGTCKDKMTEAEARCKDLRRMSYGHIIDICLETALAQSRCQNFSSNFCVAVNAAVCNYNAVFLGCIRTPQKIFFNEIANIFSPYKTVERADKLNFKTGCLAKNLLYLRSVFSNNVCKVNTCIVEIIAVEIYFVCKQSTILCPKCTECICGEEYLVGCIISNHYFGPMNHGSINKCKVMFACTKHAAFVYDVCFFLNIHAEELVNHACNFFVADQNSFGVTKHDLFDKSCMVGFHVLHNEKVQLAATESILKVFKEKWGDSLVHGVNKYGGIV